MKRDKLFWAKYYLEEFRSELVHPRLRYLIEEELADNHANLSDIGTTAEELVRLEREGYLALAKRCLEHGAKEPSRGVEDAIGYLRRAGARLHEIGYTQARYDELRRAGYLAEARRNLEEARTHFTWYAVTRVRNLLRPINARLGEIGTTETELKLLSVRE